MVRTRRLDQGRRLTKSLLVNKQELRSISEMESRAEPPESASNGFESTPGRSRAPRLFIKEMVMRNFKSYAGEQRVGPFHKVRVSSLL